MFKVIFKIAAGSLLLGLFLPGCTGAPRGQQAEPLWVRSPDAVYHRNNYIAAVGYGRDRKAAEEGALVALTALFGQSVQGDLKTVNTYSEAVKNGTVQVSEDTSMWNAINISAQMDSLVGAEIADVWFDGKSTHYAVAVMERSQTALLYSDMIRSNLRIIENLVTIPAEEKNSLESYSRYCLAGLVADTNQVFAAVLAVVGGGPAAPFPGGLKKGDDYRIEALGIAQNIPITVLVSGDSGDRIKNVFAAALNQAGFRSGGDNSRYILEAVLTLSPVDFPGQQNKFVRYTVDSSLKDTRDGTVLLPFTVNGREGHLTAVEAENRAVTTAVREINSKYGEVLSAWLAGLLPDRKPGR